MVQGKNHYLDLIVLIPCNTWERLKEINGVLHWQEKIQVFGVIHSRVLNSCKRLYCPESR